MRSSSGARTDPLGQSIGAKVCFGVKVEDDDGAGHLPFTGVDPSGHLTVAEGGGAGISSL
jgi:hypothetical protein